MIMIIVKWVAVAIIIAICAASAYAGWFDLLEEQQEEIKDEIEFERRRAYRQAEFDRHQKAVARRCLVDTWADIHFVGTKEDNK